MRRSFQITILTTLLIGLLGCSQSGPLLRPSPPPPWIERNPVLPGYFFSIGFQDGGANAGELAAQHARDGLSKDIQPQVFDWMESYVIDRAGMINEDQTFYLKQALPAVMDQIVMVTIIEDKYTVGTKHWVLLKLNQELAHKMVLDQLKQDKTLQKKIQVLP